MLLLLINSKVLPKWKSNFHPTNSAGESLLLCTIMDKPFVVVQALSRVQLFEAPGAAACHRSLSFTLSWSLLKFMSTELGMPSKHLILCHLLFLLPSIFPSIKVFSSESHFCIRWPKN